jgi:hypothetical protein
MVTQKTVITTGKQAIAILDVDICKLLSRFNDLLPSKERAQLSHPAN